MAITKVKLIADSVISNVHINSLTTDALTEGEKLFYTDARVSSYLAANNFATTGAGYFYDATLSANMLTFSKSDGTTDSVDLSLYLDDTNLARLVSGTLDALTGVATFTRDDSSTFTIDFSAFLSDANDYVSSGSFNTTTGVLTLTRLGGGTVTVDLDGKYAEASHTHLWADITDKPTALSAFTNDLGNYGGFLTSFTETDPTVPSHVKSITTTNISNWDTAYGWGNHANTYSLLGHTHSYLPLSGGTLTGTLTINADDGVKVTYSTNDGDTWLRGWGIESNRGAVYLRPTTNNAQTLIIGYSEGNLNWGTVSVDAASFDFNGNAIIHAGNIGSQSVNYATTAATANNALALSGYALDGATSVATRIFNNKGQAHGTYTDFNTAMTPGPNYLQGGTNGPTGTTSQWYGFMLGLGSQYNTETGNANGYASQLYWNRQSSAGFPYLYARDLEAGTWGSWRKMSAGYADTAGSASSVAWGNISSIPSLWYQSGSWYADFASYSFVRENGVSMSGGSEFVLMSKSGQGHVLIDGSYWAGEGNGFYSLNSGNQYTSQVGFARDSNAFAAFNTTVSAVNDVRAPIFYDSNNTGYYVDPTSTSNLAGLNVGGNAVITAGNIGNQSVNYANSAGNADTVDSLHAEVFYRNIGFGSGYPSWNLDTVGADRSGFTYSNAAPYTGPFIHIGASGYGLQLNAPYSGDGYGLSFRTRNGDAASWNSWRYPAVYNVNANGGGSLYSTIYYDQNNTSHYIDAAGGSNIRNLYVGDSGSSWSDPGGWGTQLHVSNGPHSIIRVYARSEGIETGMYSHVGGQSKVGSLTNHNFSLIRNYTVGLTLYSGYVQAEGSSRAPIFYDSDNTGYYVDPASTSNLAGLTVANQISGSVSGGSNYVVSTGYGNGTYTWRQSSTTFGPYNGWHNYLISNHGDGSTYYNTIIAMPFWGTPRYSRLEGGAQRGPYEFWVSEAAINSQYNVNAPAFYDYNDTNWYLDPSNQSIVKTIVFADPSAMPDPFTYIYTMIDSYGAGFHDVTYCENGGMSTGGLYFGRSNTGEFGNMGAGGLGFEQYIGAGGVLGQFGCAEMRFSNDLTGEGLCFNSHCSGHLYIGGTLFQNYYSDIKYKTNITTIESALDKIDAIRGVEFDWNELGKEEVNKEGREAGVIAQEVQSVYPIAVREVDKEKIDKVSTALVVDYEKLIPLLVQGIKELRQEINDIKQQINGGSI